ncbi:hypothetical protein ACULMA_06025, partial [Xanthomonas arboricola pv. corylina]
QLVGCFPESLLLSLGRREVGRSRVEACRLFRLQWEGGKKPVGPIVIRTTHRRLLLANVHTDSLDASLPVHRRGTLRGMDAA